MSSRFLLPLFLVAALAGCGSKISEANYYRVQHGMSEEDVEDLLGPAHEESTQPATATGATRPAPRKLKTWRRGALAIHVAFEDGKVVSRSGDGVPGEDLSPVTRPAAHPPGTD